jgi:hypothetical protein
MKAILKASVSATLLLGANAAMAADIGVAGQWDAVLSRNGADILFRLDITGEGAGLKGVFYDGFKP